MDVKSGATVGFITALGIAAGAGGGLLLGEIADVKRPGNLAVFLGVAGGLVGAFFGGTMVAPSPAALPGPVPPPAALPPTST